MLYFPVSRMCDGLVLYLVSRYKKTVHFWQRSKKDNYPLYIARIFKSIVTLKNGEGGRFSRVIIDLHCITLDDADVAY